MPYYTDTVASFTLLKSVIETHCVTNGWVLSNDILSKDSCFFKLIADGTNYLALQGGLGQTGSTLTSQPTNPPNNGENYVRIANYSSFEAMLFPIKYHLFIFNNPIEVYCLIEYNSGYYQHLAFGKSNLAGIGLGAWFTGSSNFVSNLSSPSALSTLSPTITNIYFYSAPNSFYSTPTAGLFVGIGNQNSSYNFPTSYVYTDLDSLGWVCWPSIAYSCSYVASLLTALPNLSNQATILLPIKAVMYRASGGVTLLANMVNSRVLRIDNHEPNDIITFGSDQWMIFPWIKRDITNRNGGFNIYHSGTFGFAIRYEV